MKFSRAREGEKFVFPDRGGLWTKTGEKSATMVFPDKTRQCSDINTELEVYVIFERDAKKPEKPEKPERVVVKTTGAVKVILVDRQTLEAILEIPDASPQQVAAYSYSEDLRMTPQGKRKPRDYAVDEVVMDHDSQSLILVLRDVSGKDGSGVIDV